MELYIEVPVNGTVIVNGEKLICLENPSGGCRHDVTGSSCAFHTRARGKISSGCSCFLCTPSCRTDGNSTVFLPYFEWLGNEYSDESHDV